LKQKQVIAAQFKKIENPSYCTHLTLVFPHRKDVTDLMHEIKTA